MAFTLGSFVLVTALVAFISWLKTRGTDETNKDGYFLGGRSLTGIDLNSNDLRYRRMLSNGRVRDTDGFLFDGENTHFNTLR